VSEGRLRALGIETLAQLVDAPEALLRPIFGSYTAGIRCAARGEGADDLGRERPAFREHDPHGASVGSISNERTFVETGPDPAHEVLSALCERVAARARRRGIVAGQVTLKLRYTDFDTLTRGRTIAPTSADFELHRVVLELYREARTRPLPIRLLGVALAKLRPGSAQLALFDDGERRGVAVDRVREKFGYDAVHLATTLGPRYRRASGGRAGEARAMARGGPQVQSARRRAQ
jgi:DNA polymerase IV